MKPREKKLFVVTHGLNELDVILPLVAGLRSECDVEATVLIVVRGIFKQYQASPFYAYAAKKLGCKVIYSRMPNIFDEDFLWMKNNRLFNPVRLAFRGSLYLKWLILIWMALRADTVLHEISNHLKSTRPLYWVHWLIGKRPMTYKHGYSINIGKKAAFAVALANRAVGLSFNTEDLHVWKDLGYRDVHVIGYPLFFSEWRDIVESYTPKGLPEGEIALIFTRPVHSHYMDKEKYVELLLSAYKAFRKRYGNIPIIIKKHPTEFDNTAAEVIRDHGLQNVIISKEYNVVLAAKAKICVCFFTSAILSGFLWGKPSVTHYQEARRLREYYPEGIPYKALGLRCTENTNDLEEFFKDVDSGQYAQPEFVANFFKHRNLTPLRG